MGDFRVSRGTLGRYKIGDDDFTWTQLENENDAERVCELVNGLNDEIARLRAEVDRVRAQRDNAAKLLWGECEGDLGTGKGDVLLHGIGLHYDGNEVKEIEQ